MMNILQKLVRANALLLQGAYRGAEHVLDSAIVEARSLIEENAHLQSAIDQANAQEPIGEFDGRFKFCDGEWSYGAKIYADLPSVGDKIYAKPAPVQQSIDRDTIIDVLLSIGNMSEGIIADAIISAIGAQQSQGELRYCNDCDWIGTTDRMCGSIGQLCPECGETTGVE